MQWVSMSCLRTFFLLDDEMEEEGQEAERSGPRSLLSSSLGNLLFANSTILQGPFTRQVHFPRIKGASLITEKSPLKETSKGGQPGPHPLFPLTTTTTKQVDGAPVLIEQPAALQSAQSLAASARRESARNEERLRAGRSSARPPPPFLYVARCRSEQPAGEEGGREGAETPSPSSSLPCPRGASHSLLSLVVRRRVRSTAPILRLPPH